jgi:hypothetical protein
MGLMILGAITRFVYWYVVDYNTACFVYCVSACCGATRGSERLTLLTR